MAWLGAFLLVYDGIRRGRSVGFKFRRVIEKFSLRQSFEVGYVGVNVGNDGILVDERFCRSVFLKVDAKETCFPNARGNGHGAGTLQCFRAMFSGHV
jgi:hypothetical protein